MEERGRLLTRHDWEKIFPRGMFSNQKAWEITIDNRLLYPYRMCKECPFFIDVDFNTDNIGCDKDVQWGGICTKHHDAVNKYKVRPCL